MTDRKTFAIKRPCAECPWRRDVPVGKFPPSRYQELAETCEPGGIHKVFACHMTPEGEERACAGMLKVVGSDVNMVRYAIMMGWFNPDEIRCDSPLYDGYREMAEANGVDPDDPVLLSCR